MSVILLPEPTGSMLSPAGSSDSQTLIARSIARMRQIGRGIADWIDLAIREAQFRRAARELARLDDHILRDIGITRSEIDSVVRGTVDGDRSPLRAAFGLAPAHVE